jgi:hypothetical protein
MGNAIALLVVGTFLAAVATWRLYSGRSYISKPAMLVTRKIDPFSFWLSEGTLIIAAALLFIGGAISLFQ